MVCFLPPSNVHPCALRSLLNSPIDTAILYSKMGTRGGPLLQQRYALMRFAACGRQRLVKRHERGIHYLADRKQIAIAQCFRRREARYRASCRTEGQVKLERFLPDSDSRIFQPAVVHLPGAADGLHILAHHGGRRQQPQQPELREPAKEETVVLLPGKPGPCGIGVPVVGPTQGKPHVQIRQIRRRTDSPGRDCRRRAYPSSPPAATSHAAMGASQIRSRWRR